jgi:hypothetical protein
MKIIVPSLGRAGTAASMKWLPQTNRKIIFAVHHNEIYDYQNSYPNCEFMILSDSCRHHTGLVRKEIMDQIHEPFIFVDDDIRISIKSTKSIEKIFDTLEMHLISGASIVGLAPQLFSNFIDTVFVNGDPWCLRNQFVATVYAINPLDFDTCPLEQLPVYEDAALCIHAIQYGGGTIVTHEATHSNVSPDSGGCNAWRNKKITIDCMTKMVELYPEICSLKETTNKTHSQDLGIGLKIAWKKIQKLS